MVSLTAYPQNKQNATKQLTFLVLVILLFFLIFFVGGADNHLVSNFFKLIITGCKLRELCIL